MSHVSSHNLVEPDCSAQAPAAVIFHRLGPYHLARLRAAAKRIPIVAIELVGKDTTYAWEVVRGPQGFPRVTLFEAENHSGDTFVLETALRNTLERESPACVVLPGWSPPGALIALAWASSHSVPIVMMSESQDRDRRRNPLGENIKRRVLSLCSSALVGGSSHAAYLAKLGLPRERAFCGYDVVDNEHFRSGAERARADGTLRARLGLPGRFFLASCRFVAAKNLGRLLEAYSRYRKSSSDPWGLVLLGDGPLRPDVEGGFRRLGLETHVLAPGFIQYDTLPAYYALAGAFIVPSVMEPWGLVVNEAMAAGLPVLVSERCGSAPDLVEEGRNGFTFDPYCVEQPASLMLKVSAMAEGQRQAMGRASQEIISRWSLDLFAQNLEKAIQAALRAPRRSVSVLDRLLLWALIHR